MEVSIEPSWKKLLEGEFNKSYFHELVLHIKNEIRSGKILFPPGPLIFNAFNSTPFDQVKVIIIGQDPYHGPGQAHGLSFSVPDGVKPPPSLVNIFKEIKQDIGLTMSSGKGDLSHWASQGVLLLNAALTVRSGEPFSHANIGWSIFTNAVIELLSKNKSGLVFLLWGRFAQEKNALINDNHHLILTAAHPSPFSADKGFFGCAHFSKTNAFLIKHGLDPIDWRL
ncbi:MAG: uracil-DNA glycosylase [Ferruginibacter sp.]